MTEKKQGSPQNNVVENDAALDALIMEEAEPGKTELPTVKTQPVVWEEFPDATAMRAYVSNLSDIKEEIVAVPEWRMTFLVRGLTSGVRLDLVQSNMTANNTPNLVSMYPDLIIRTCRHPGTKELVFKPADRDMLNQRSGGVIERLAMAAARLSGLDSESQASSQRNFQES